MTTCMQNKDTELFWFDENGSGRERATLISKALKISQGRLVAFVAVPEIQGAKVHLCKAKR